MAELACHVCDTRYPVGTVVCQCGNILVGHPSAPDRRHGSAPPTSPDTPPSATREQLTGRLDRPDSPSRQSTSSGQRTRRDLEGHRFELVGSGLRIAVKDEVRIGRDPDWSPLGHELAAHDLVSGKHATLWVSPFGELVVRDEGSTNGTQVNGQPCSPGSETVVAPGSVLRLSGQLTLHVERGGTA